MIIFIYNYIKTQKNIAKINIFCYSENWRKIS